MFFSSNAFHYQLGSLSAGSGLKHIHLEHFRRFFIPLPPLEEQQRLIQVQQLWERDFATADSHLLKLRHVRTALLRDLLTPPAAVTAEPLIAAE